MDHTDPQLFAAHIRRCRGLIERALEASGFDALLIHAGLPRLRFLDDQAVPFTPNPHFAWLVPGAQSGCGVLLRPARQPRLFYPRAADFWHLPPPEPAPWWAETFEIFEVGAEADWVAGLEAPNHLAVIADDTAAGDGARLGGTLNPEPLLNRLHLARTVKSEWEQACIGEANRRAARGHAAVAAAFGPGVSEFELHLAYLSACGQMDNELPYDSIVALNEHAATLHFTELERAVPAVARSLLIDAGASCNGYAADITRTYAAADQVGFTELTARVEALQGELVAGVKPGVDYRDLHLQAHRLVAGGLREMGIVDMAVDSMVEAGVSGVFFPHGLGHFIGLQVHDVAGLMADAEGGTRARPEGHPALRLTRELEPGNVVTVEPGIYFIPMLLRQLREGRHGASVHWDRVEAMAPCGGVRIEDDVLVTDGEPRNLTREAFAGG